MKPSTLVAIAITLVAVPVLTFVLMTSEAPPRPGGPPPDAGTPGMGVEPAPVAAAGPKAVAAESDLPLSPEDAAFAERLRERFAATIDNAHAQIKAIEQIVAYLMQRYPDDWRERVGPLLSLLFPGMAEELIAKFEKLMAHNDWLRDNREALLKMSPEDRRRALWDARRAAFGEQAEEIWAAELRGQRVQQELAAIEAAPGYSLEDKLSRYLGAVNEAYGEKAPQFIESRQTELMNRFLDVTSVQDDLHRLPPAERAAALRQIRSSLGMDQEALKRWDELDRQRDQAWDTGQRYLQERERILAQVRGEEQAQQLRALQDQTFGEEAETIRSEEASGFQRFDRRRNFGRE